jgi:hypothetical protein
VKITGKKADNTSKDGVMIQRVIRVVGSGTSYHALTKTNYSGWALLKKVKLKARALWSVIEDSGADQQQEMMALDALCGTVPPEMVSMITKKDTTKEAWEEIVTMRIDDDHVKKAMMQQLYRKFNLNTFDDDETIEDYTLRLSGMAAHIATLREEVKDGEILMKMLRSMPLHLKQIMIAMKTLLYVSTMFVADLTKQLKEVFEEVPMLLQQDGKKCEAENHSSGIASKGRGHGWGHGCGGSSSAGSSNKPTGDVCLRCGKMGHWARECRSKPTKERVHVTQEKEEGSLLLVMAT